MDRFGLRIIVHGLTETKERLAAYRRVHEYLENRRGFIQRFAPEINDYAQEEIQVDPGPAETKLRSRIKLRRPGSALIQQLGIESLRAEITLFETAQGLHRRRWTYTSHIRRPAHRCADGLTTPEIRIHDRII